MRVLNSQTGLFSAYSQSSAAPNGEYVIFKKCSDIFNYFEPQNPHQNKDLRLVIEDVVHRRDSIFDFAHLSDGRFVVLLQSSPENLVHLAEASINLQEELVRVTQMLKENIEIRTKGGQSKLIRDEFGPVLVTFPNNFADESPESRTVKLFHIGDFIEKSINTQKNVRIDRRIGVNELWCDPFISRNALYFYNQLDSGLLCISVVDESTSTSSRARFSARLLRTHASAVDSYSNERPSIRFFRRDTIIFDNFALVYFSQLVGSESKPRRSSKKSPSSTDATKCLWKLWLNSLVWEPVNLDSVSADFHLPTNRVSFKQSSQDQATTVFLHGQCGKLECGQKQHFYELEIFGRRNPLTNITNNPQSTATSSNENSPQKRPTVLRRFVKFASSGSRKPQHDSPCRNKAASLAASQSKSASCHSLLAIANRSNPNANENARSKRMSIVSEQLFNNSENQEDDYAGPSSSSSVVNLVNWSRQMALQGTENNRLSEQLKYAKEMGFSDNEIWTALDMNNKNNRGAYEAFESISAMIDALSLAQKKTMRSSTSSLANSTAYFNGSTTTLPVYLDESGKQAERAAKLPSWISSTALSSMANSSPHQTLPTNRSSQSSGVNRSMSFNDSLGMRRSLAQSMNSLNAGTNRTQNGGGRSSVQRLIDTFENENRRHFEEFQRINSELRRKLENSVHEEETLRDLLRLRQEKIRQQEILLKNQNEMEKRVEKANLRLQDMLKDMQLREADILRHQNNYDSLQRRHEAEMRKSEEVKQTLNCEIGRLIREQERQVELARQNEMLRVELQAKNAEIRSLAAPNPQIEQLNIKLEKLNADLSRLVAEKRELEENVGQGPVCGVCMDNRREVIFMPCLHFTCCKRCANSMDHCSICRLRIMGKIEFFQ